MRTKLILASLLAFAVVGCAPGKLRCVNGTLYYPRGDGIYVEEGSACVEDLPAAGDKL